MKSGRPCEGGILDGRDRKGREKGQLQTWLGEEG